MRALTFPVLLPHLLLSPLPPLLLLPVSATLALAAVRYPSGLIVQHLSGPEDCPRPIRAHDTISTHYRGTLQSDGSLFEESYTSGSPFEFTIGVGQVIQGWDLGLLGMCPGQKRRLTIPPELAYGSDGSGSKIPGGATLVFETELLRVVKQSSLLPAVEPPVGEYIPDEERTSATPAAAAVATAIAANNPGDHPHASDKPAASSPVQAAEEEAQCNLLGNFALLVQGALGVLAVLGLVYKRWREPNKRPWKIFIFDVSKQLFGSMLLHAINLVMSMMGSVDVANAAAASAAVAAVAVQGAAEADGKTPNPCSFYLLNLGIDTTLGVPVLYILLKTLHVVFLHTALANPPESIKSGNYDNPPRITWYFKQLLIYCVGLSLMKLFVFFLFLAMPFLPWIGDWALRWTEGNEALQIVFAMFLFPLAMNAVQYWIIDNFIMDKKAGGNDDQKYSRVDTGEEGDDDHRPHHDSRSFEVDDGDDELGRRPKTVEVRENEVVKHAPLMEIHPVPIDDEEVVRNRSGGRGGRGG